ncbi:ABC transporter substrate-binding protein [Nocardia panacis]|uniref:ABC transporter substrate-binding protein n=2 Tax=Nocardia panacis TaxID=2340916 RepID=A0A3A4KRN5_9NOCA|nr:ABC transporter substrate-binding protein [Nocardia panacis]
MSRTHALPLALVGALAGCLVACAGESTSGSGTSEAANSPIPDTTSIISAVAKDPQLNAALPASITQAGTLHLASYVQSAPNNFYAADGKTPVGYEVDLSKAIAAKLGVGVEHQDMAFGSLITSLQSGRVDATMAAMSDTKVRQEQIDFVDYFTSGIAIMIRKGDPDAISGPDALCGKAVAVVQATSQQKFVAAQSGNCTRAGKSAITITETESDNQNQTQLRTGRVQAIVNDLPTAVYVSRTAGAGKFFDVVPGEPIDGGPFGIGVAKQNRALTETLQKAVNGLIADGTYGKILHAWGVEKGAIKEAVVNGGN